MSALDNARAAAQEVLDHEWVDASTGVFIRAEDLRALLDATAPPTDDEREALFTILDRFIPAFADEEFDREMLTTAASQVLDAGFRRRDPITDEAVDAAARVLARIGDMPWSDVDVWGGTWEEWRDRYYEKARDALEAAEAAR